MLTFKKLCKHSISLSPILKTDQHRNKHLLPNIRRGFTKITAITFAGGRNSGVNKSFHFLLWIKRKGTFY